MAYSKVTVTGVAASAAIPLNYQQKDFKVSLAAVISATAAYTVQHTFDKIMEGVTPTWFDHEVMDGLAVNSDGNYAYPIMGTRINVTASTGDVTFYVIQAS